MGYLRSIITSNRTDWSGTYRKSVKEALCKPPNIYYFYNKNLLIKKAYTVSEV